MKPSLSVASLILNVACLALCVLVPQAANAAGVSADAAIAPVSESRDQSFAVRMDNGSHILVRVCRPATDTPARLVVINHGSPPDPAARPRMQVGSCDQEAVKWFLSRGYVVALPLRRGYGATGGEWAETYGGCDHADYFHAGLETARDIDAAVHLSLSRCSIAVAG